MEDDKKGDDMEEKENKKTNDAKGDKKGDNTEEVEKELHLYDMLKFNMGLVDSFINCMNGFGSAATMTEQQKRDFLDCYSLDDVEILYENDFI